MNEPAPSLSTRRPALPLGLKLGYALFVAVLVPVYAAQYGPANFLWFSNIALLLTLVGVWIESRLLVGMQALSVMLLELVWTGDYLSGLLFGTPPVGLTAYMFDPGIPLFVRGLSLYHVLMPPLLAWLVYRLGYDRRALPAQTILAWSILLICFFFTDPQENINWVFGWGDEPQTLLPPGLYLLAVLLFFPLVVYLPTHLLLQHLLPTKHEAAE